MERKDIAKGFAARVQRDVKVLPSLETKSALADELAEVVNSPDSRKSVRTLRNLLSGMPRSRPSEWNEWVTTVHDFLARRYIEDGVGTIEWEASNYFFPDDPTRGRTGAQAMTARLEPRDCAAPVTDSTYESASLDDWQDSFALLFNEAESDLPMTELLRHLVVDSTRLTEAFRKERYDEALEWFPRMFSWICSIATRGAQHEDLSPEAKRLSAVVWQKFPNVCSLCARPDCICGTLDADAMDKAERDELRSTKLRAARDVTEHKPERLDEWVSMFDKIYRIPHSSTSAATKMMHYWEEVGELENELWQADCRRHEGDKSIESDWEDELADVFSWLISTFRHIQRYVDGAERLTNAFDSKKRRLKNKSPLSLGMPTFSELVWLTYGGKRELECEVCSATVCGCHDKITFPRR